MNMTLSCLRIKSIPLIVIACFCILTAPVYAQQTTQSHQWQKIAKRTQAQKTAGLAGGEGWQMIFGIAYAPSNPNTVYMAIDTSQVWKSIDGGFSWNRKAVGFLANGGLSVAVDPTNENIAYVAGGVISPGMESFSPVEAIFRTTDGGDTWNKVKDVYFPREASGGVHIAFAGSTIYAGPTNTGILKSTNGTSWNLLANAEVGMCLQREYII